MNKAVLVTTEFRAIFFGYVKDDTKAPAEIILTGVRNCIYWPVAAGGFLGMVSDGPKNKDYRIGARVPEVTLYKITSVSPVSDSVARIWDEAPTYGAK